MTNFIPIFPLEIVVYPGEQLNLHIFEPRYKQLINDCFAEGKPFGIPTVLTSGVSEYGTLVSVKEIANVYEDGKMDIKTEGLVVFRILETIKSLPEKLYSGAIVNYPPNDVLIGRQMLKRVLQDVRTLHTLLQVTKDFRKPDDQLTAYDLAHHAGMSLDEEYELLNLLREDQRLEYLKRHVAKVMQVMADIEILKEKIKLNGHFKNLSSEFNL